MRRSYSYSLTSQMDRGTDWSGRGAQALQQAILRKLKGYRKVRETPVGRAELLRWFRRTPPMAIDIGLTGLLDGGLAKRVGKDYLPGRFLVRHRYPNGDLMDQQHFDGLDEAKAEMEATLRTAYEGEKIVLVDVRGGTAKVVDEGFGTAEAPREAA